MTPDSRPLERDLHAYVDHRLDAAGNAKIDTWLREQPEEALRLRDWQHQNELLRAAFDPVLDETVPSRLTKAARGHPAAGWRRWPVAAALGGLAVGLLIGLAGPRLWPGSERPLVATATRPATVPATLPRFPHRAAVAHAVYAVEQRHPVEVGREQEAHLVQWLSKRTGITLRTPDFSAQGFALMGGRLLPGDAGAAAQFMFEDAQQRRVTLYLGREAAATGSQTGERAFRYATEGGVGVFYWIGDDVSYALSGDIDRSTLLALAETAYATLSQPQ